MLEHLFLFLSGFLGPIVGIAVAAYLFHAAGVTDGFLLASLSIGFGAPAGYLLEQFLAALFTRSVGLQQTKSGFLTLLTVVGVVSALCSVLAVVASTSMAREPWMDVWFTVFGFSVFLAAVSGLVMSVRRRRAVKVV